MKKIDRTAKIFDLDVFSGRTSEVLSYLESHLLEPKPVSTLLTVATPNPEQIVLAAHEPKFKAILNDFNVRIPDGVGLVVASKILFLKTKKPPIRQRIAGVDVVEALCQRATDEQWPMVVIGGRGYHHLSQRFPTAVWLEGYREVAQPTKAEEQIITATLIKLKPRIVFVALGAPYQEQWVSEHRSLLAKAGVRLAMVTGGSFDFILGKVKRAPTWVRAMNLEWLYRLIQEPWRWKRQLRLFRFMAMVGQALLA